MPESFLEAASQRVDVRRSLAFQAVLVGREDHGVSVRDEVV